MKALGFIETNGFVAAVEAADSALKSANVSLLSQMRAGSALVMVIVTGDVAAVKAAVEAGASSASKVGKVIAVQVIASPHEGMEAFIGKSEQMKSTGGSETKKPAVKQSPGRTPKKSPGV